MVPVPVEEGFIDRVKLLVAVFLLVNFTKISAPLNNDQLSIAGFIIATFAAVAALVEDVAYLAWTLFKASDALVLALVKAWFITGTLHTFVPLLKLVSIQV